MGLREVATRPHSSGRLKHLDSELDEERERLEAKNRMTRYAIGTSAAVAGVIFFLKRNAHVDRHAFMGIVVLVATNTVQSPFFNPIFAFFNDGAFFSYSKW
jgi:hypothetical protein